MTGSGATRDFRYDKFSRPMSSKLTVAGESTAWESFSAYDAMSRVREIVYPVTGLTLAYAYNAWGYLSTITEPAAANRIHWQANSRYADGQINSQAVGGYTTTKSYDALGRPAAIATTGIQNATYGFDALGNLTSRADTISGLNETVVYDSLNRLKEVKQGATTSPTPTAWPRPAATATAISVAACSPA